MGNRNATTRASAAAGTPAAEPGLPVIAPRSAERFIAADVGGTHARVGLIRSNDDGQLAVLAYRKYSCGDYPGLTAILSAFVAEFAPAHDAGTRRMAIASAGVVLDTEVINSNLPWRISLPELRDTLRLDELHVINDFAAAAHGAQCLDPAESRLLTPGVEAAAAGPVLVIGPGTGLGAAICVPHPRGGLVLPTEAGMTAFAPGSEREIEILRWMRQRAPHVSTEQLLSGPGLVNLYDALSAIEGRAATLRAPAAISDAARQGDAVAREAVLTFCALLGSVIGDLAVISSATSVFVAGGIVPQLTDFLPHSAFRTRLVDKGAMRPVLERVPVRLIENERLGVIGAANWYLQHLHDRQDAGHRHNHASASDAA